MKRACRPYWEGIIELAEGRTNPAASDHVSTCADCALRLDELRRTMAAAKSSWFSAPDELAARAKALMPGRARRRAVLVGTTLAGAFARSTSEDFQVTIDLGGPRMRLMIARESSGWSLVGQTPPGEWSIETATGDVRREAGRFRILVSDLKASAFVLRGPDYDVDIPAMSEIHDARD